MNLINNRSTLFILIAMILMAASVGAQTTSPRSWYSGTGSATGKSMEEIRIEALNNARSDALQKAGIEVSAGTLSLKSEGNNGLIDFFSEFAESSTRGLILDERDVRFDRPEPLDSTYTVYRVIAHVEVQVGAPQGKPDPAFKVTLSSARETYMEYEPATLNVNSTESGYLTILDIHGDSINVLFPNVIDQKNYLSANTDFVFPPSKAYSLEFETDKGTSSSADIIIAIVTKDDVPFPNINKVGLERSRLLLGEKTLTTYAKWLYRIPLDRRSFDRRLIQVQKKSN
ncbi:MAG: DUF4384 domain-containing protein [Bacteroidetes bacterium]|nr:DUF4384 domain-containing protein [Bacteroidota bacterium]MCL5738212.1 DUF4384 domain-containing protein [Bacteroidota bacterium]